MKKASPPKKSPAAKVDKSKDSGELRKPTKLKPLKEKEKKNWKNTLDEVEDEEFDVAEDDLKLDDDFVDEEDEDGFFDDNF